MVKFVESPIDLAQVCHSICSAYSGAVVLRYAIVKKQAGSGKSTIAVEYLTQGDTLSELEDIARELERRWNLEDVLLIHRTGCLAVGEIISLAAASAPDSEDAFEACRFGISRLEKMATIAKNETFSEVS